jgi:DNA-binding CsgD family transcriptional regulator
LHGDALRLQGGIAYFEGHTEAGSSLLLDAAVALEAAGRAGAVSAAADAVNASIPSAEPSLMLAAAQKARELAPQDGSEEDFEASVALGYALCFNGKVTDGEALLRRGVDLFTARTGVAAPLQIGRLAWGLGWLGRHEEAHAHVAGTIRLARAAGAVASLPYLLGASAWHAVHLGRLSEAYADASEELDLAEQLGQPLATAQALPLISWVQALRGDEEACRQRAEEALHVNGDLGLELYRLLAWLALGLLEAGAGRWDASIQPFEQAARGMEERGLYVGGVAPALELAEAYIRADRHANAEAILASFDRTELASVPLPAAIAARCRGLLAGPDGFEPLFLTALAYHARADYPFALARTQLAYGEMLRRSGRRVDAREHLQRAAGTFDRLGARAWLSRAHDELRASGQRLRRGTDVETELTPRELQVALQVAAGKSNKEAGAALFLSPKTIEYHLKGIYRKLDMHSRAELIRRFARGDSIAASG